MTPASPELVALLAACRARPADDLPRLVLADWLDENGQPERAEFIRIQVEVSHPTANVERIRGLKKREADLLAEHENEWTAGFLVAVTKLAAASDRLARSPSLRFVRGLPRIDEFTTEMVDRAELQEWLKSPEQLWVEQVDVNISTPGWFVKANLPDELHGRVGMTLWVDQTNPSDRRQYRLLANSGNFTFVRALTVMAAVPDPVLEEISSANVENLVAVKVAGGQGQRVAEVIASAPFSSLSSLNLGPLNEAGLRALIASPYLGNLTHLNLVASPIGDGGMVALCRSGLAHTLRRVEFPNTGISDVGVTALAKSPLFALMLGQRPNSKMNRIGDDGLKRLNLNMNRIGDDGLKAIAESEHLMRFSELALRENVVGDDGVEALAASPFAANLQFLDFWRNRITDRGAFALARSPHLNKVMDLNVKENAVGPAGAAALSERFGEKAKT